MRFWFCTVKATGWSTTVVAAALTLERSHLQLERTVASFLQRNGL